MISTLAVIARELCKTPESIATPSWVNTRGMVLRPPCDLILEIANCDIKFADSS
jgi:hypothetical protein